MPAVWEACCSGCGRLAAAGKLSPEPNILTPPFRLAPKSKTGIVFRGVCPSSIIHTSTRPQVKPLDWIGIRASALHRLTPITSATVGPRRKSSASIPTSTRRSPRCAGLLLRSPRGNRRRARGGIGGTRSHGPAAAFHPPLAFARAPPGRRDMTPLYFDVHVPAIAGQLLETSTAKPVTPTLELG